MKSVAPSTHIVESHRVLTALVCALAAVAFGVTGWLFGVQPLASAIGHWKLALDYSEVPAKVVTREGKTPDGATLSWLAASYEVSGKTYFAERLSVLDDDSPGDVYNSRVLGRLEAAKRRSETINVYVSQLHPEIAVVSNALPLPSLICRVPLALGFTLLAGVGLLGALGALCNSGYSRRLRKYWKSWAVVATLCAIFFHSCCKSAPMLKVANLRKTYWSFLLLLQAVRCGCRSVRWYPTMTPPKSKASPRNAVGYRKEMTALEINAAMCAMLGFVRAERHEAPPSATITTHVSHFALREG